jgi:hypothetical protein
VPDTPEEESTQTGYNAHLAHDESLKGLCCKARSLACSQGSSSAGHPGWSKPVQKQARCWYTRQHAHVCAASWPNLWASPGLPNVPHSLTSKHTRVNNTYKPSLNKVMHTVCRIEGTEEADSAAPTSCTDVTVLQDRVGYLMQRTKRYKLVGAYDQTQPSSQLPSKR